MMNEIEFLKYELERLYTFKNRPTFKIPLGIFEDIEERIKELDAIHKNCELCECGHLKDNHLEQVGECRYFDNKVARYTCTCKSFKWRKKVNE